MGRFVMGVPGGRDGGPGNGGPRYEDPEQPGKSVVRGRPEARSLELCG